MIIYETRPSPAPTMWEKLTVSDMAATMQDMNAAGEAVTPENLRLRGYSLSDITCYGLKAANLARKRAIKVTA
ncbi:hypothetical protein [Pseudochrobactrum saccharolyticum]|uniref:hypothetical protein n=1 Tax=Pseudochrobactrum saccharolyticum TaxID=354352 RepID=UPI00276F6573|nr:hypothetical protein [Pseudochrobactrum saccharolyticum]MDP8249596.1 hypothetical protein [Pseudochrobactrum saccharolyticum]